MQNSQVVQDHKEKDKCLSILGERDMVGRFDKVWEDFLKEQPTVLVMLVLYFS